jgi:putative FmdB family regulatory protein
MPTYEYKCDACGEQFERFQSITAVPIKKCPKCGKRKVKRLLGTGAGLIFKGSGFYITDYRSDSYNKSAKADGGGDKSTSTTDAGSSASKSGESATAGKSTPSTKTESKPASSPKSKADSSK